MRRQAFGAPVASRAIGIANSRNPLAIVVPCHRVIGADGSLTGYAGGLQNKEWLLRHYPDRYRHVMSLIRSMRDGKDYDAEWGKRMKGSGPYAWQISRRFEMATKRLGLMRRSLHLREDLFVSPNSDGVQLSLL